MNKSDKLDFYEAMTKLFISYGKTISVELMEEWFEDLLDYSFFQIKKAFRDYKMDNVYAPVIASIRKYANRIPKENINNILKCKRIVEKNICNQNVFVHGYCEKCYDEIRQKSDIEKIFEKVLDDFYKNAKLSRCVTKLEISNFAKSKICQNKFGKSIFNKISQNEFKEQITGVSNVPATSLLGTRLSVHIPHQDFEF